MCSNTGTSRRQLGGDLHASANKPSRARRLSGRSSCRPRASVGKWLPRHAISLGRRACGGVNRLDVHVLRLSYGARNAVFVAVVGIALGADPGRQLGLDGRRMELGSDSSAVFLLHGSARERIGSAREALWIEERGEESYLVRVSRSESTVFGVHVDTIISRWPSLEPVARSTRSGECVTRIVYTDRAVIVDGCERFADKVLELQPVDRILYDGASIDLVLRASDFEVGDSVVVDGFILPHTAVESLGAEVVDRAVLRFGGVSSEVWKLRLDFVGLPTTYWIEEGSRRLIRQEVVLSPGIIVETDRFPPG